ncbi:MAG: hypothetical protein COX39_02455 [Candidatus Nealsonbacteria bacterium CG23_combo_of_CG06-09_8_20_14_all_40_13]|uniref:Solute-binding protein family 5 domain-containing protein n=1 Tax=Candidatus Nealsonbacteria bacterium CG23_combo_of_CG06-09_8_20_14_all_40_13 TaxID=1974724 RepID=A0A2G9YQN4_9BACT|nr:MAG: hypothetical protein COX39_02455 [Candidatus Nealsonbacteria bacterium CG23_combo_of_CG06-09_8_20_14_all_40_13]PIU43306.1 MAG: hypothetical protein COS97_01725 [Candidatus Nealsonbacteria bacterium CG07_land_8_20_14_0_80_40_10]
MGLGGLILKLKLTLSNVFQIIKKLFSYLIKPFKFVLRSLGNWTPLRKFKFAWQAFCVLEKYIIAILLLVILAANGKLIWDFYKIPKQYVPVAGGTFIEGIVIKNPTLAMEEAKNLTNCGLTAYSTDGKIIPAIAESWQISPDGKVYTFKIRQGFNLEEIKNAIDKAKWQGVETKIDGQNIQLTLAQPYAPFLSYTTQLILPYGPFQIEKSTKTEITLKRNDNFYQGKPYLNKVTLKFYPTDADLNIDFKLGRLTTAADVDSKRNYKTYQFPLPYSQMLFFNLKREILQDRTIRQAIAQNTPLDKDIELTLLTNDKDANVAQAEKSKEDLAKLRIKLNIISKDNLILQKVDIPTRNFDILLYEVNLGSDPDLYPLYHSSQISEQGMNLSSFSMPVVDKMLEEARTTLDENVRAADYAKVQKILDQEAPTIVLNKETYNWTVSAKVKGIIEGPRMSAAGRYLNIWQWYIKEKRVKK